MHFLAKFLGVNSKRPIAGYSCHVVLVDLSPPSRLNINVVSVHFRAQSSYKD